MSTVKQQNETLYLSGNFSFPMMVIAAYTWTAFLLDALKL